MTSFVVPAMEWISPKTGRRRFVVDGFYVQGASPDWMRKKRYERWKRDVQECAVLAGLELPLRATADRPLYVVTEAFFADGVHCDPENAHKGVVDALCYVSPLERKLGVKKGSDKYIGGMFFVGQYDSETPHIRVRVMQEVGFLRMTRHPRSRTCVSCGPREE